MRQKLKEIKLVLSLSLAGLLLFSCQVEEEFINEKPHDKSGLIMHKKFEELIQVTQFKTAFDNITKPKEGFSYKVNAPSRTVMEQQYGFTIKDYPANVVVSGSITSYTFLISRENTPSNVFENLIIKTKENEKSKAYILKYESNTSFVEIPYNYNTFKGTRTLKPIIYDDSKVNSLFDMTNCEIVTEWICINHNEWEIGCTGHEGGGATIICYGSSDVGSGTGGYSGGSDTSSSSSDGQHGGGAGGVPTSPVLPCKDCPEIDKPDPCDKIKVLLTITPTAQAELANLATKTSDVVEHGLYKLSGASVIQTPPTGSNGAVSFPILSSGAYTMLAHTHNSPATNTYSVFSYGDFLAIAELMKLGKISPDCVFTLSTADGTNYAITINDQATFLQFFALGTDPNFNMEIAMKRSEVIIEYYGENNSNPNPIIKENSSIGNNGDEKAFLDMITDLNMGVTLFEANSTFTTFSKVTHNKTTGNIDPTPCN